MEVIIIVTVYLRNGRKLDVSNNYSSIEKFIHENTGEAILLTEAHDQVNQYLVRKEAIDYIEVTIN